MAQPHLVTFVSSGPRLSVLPINSLQGLKTHLTLCASTVPPLRVTPDCGQFQVMRLLLRVRRKTEEEKMASRSEQPMFNREYLIRTVSKSIMFYEKRHINPNRLQLGPCSGAAHVTRVF